MKVSGMTVFPGKLSLYPVVITTVAAIAKAYHLGRLLGGGRALELIMVIVRNDLPLMGLVMFLSLAETVFTSRTLRVATRLFAILATFWFLIDSISVLVLTARAPVIEMVQYATELGQQKEIVFSSIAVLLPVLFLVLARTLRFSVRAPQLGLVLSFFLMLLPSREGFVPVISFSTPVFVTRENRNIFAASAAPYTEEELAVYGGAKPRYTLDAVDSVRRNIILLVIESWSAVDSFRTSGIGNLTPRLDSIMSEGMTFRHFIANHRNTEGGLVSLLTGTPPVQFKGADWTLYKTFGEQEKVLSAYHDAGYWLEFVSSSTLSFRRKGEFLKLLPFDHFDGEETVPQFYNGRDFVFNAVHDGILYDYALEQVSKMSRIGKPYLYVVETTSSHLPYQDPLSRGNSEQNVWDFVDSEAYRFYLNLKKDGFFDSGILIVTSDHHKMMPISLPERQLYGRSAEQRIPLGIIGKKIIPGGIDNRQFQQADLLSSLGRLQSSEQALSPIAISSDIYIAPMFGDNINRASVFIESKDQAYPLHLFGRSLSWQGEPPPLVNKQEAEEYVHRLRARMQYRASKSE